MGYKLYVGNLPYRITDDQLQDLFAKAGKVESAKIVTDVGSGRSRGFGFVEMTTSEEGEKAIEMFNKYSLENREIVVSRAKPRSSGMESGGPPGRREQRDRH
ncbi:MAG: RNA-binding protein [Nitrospira sp.]|nr:RNA-binding protein [Nitrospira sp.]